jgi:hypothetical protein
VPGLVGGEAIEQSVASCTFYNLSIRFAFSPMSELGSKPVMLSTSIGVRPWGRTV